MVKKWKKMKILTKNQKNWGAMKKKKRKKKEKKSEKMRKKWGADSLS